jgi:hypothetical protein
MVSSKSPGVSGSTRGTKLSRTFMDLLDLISSAFAWISNGRTESGVTPLKPKGLRRKPMHALAAERVGVKLTQLSKFRRTKRLAMHLFEADVTLLLDFQWLAPFGFHGGPL